MEARRTLPKLSLNSMTRHKSEPDGLRTPPLLRVAISVPFMWEDAPGKPRNEPIFSKPTKSPLFIRKLNLPPRMVAEELKMKESYDKDTTITISTSPTSVLKGPCPVKKNKKERKKKGAAWFERKGKRGNETDKARRESDGSVSSLSSSSDSHSSSSFNGYDEEEKGMNVKIKIRRFRRQKSLFSLSFHGTSYFWVGVYERLKQVTPWHQY
ncbi:hypothetical protein LUZ60_000343 [Juncus effusus]|nr:hypothetical protein LUZ60_000343 [Juncus effusus]